MEVAKTALLVLLAQNYYVTPQQPPNLLRRADPADPGWVLDFRALPERDDFRLTYTFHTGGGFPPFVDRISHGGFRANALTTLLRHWPEHGLMVRPAGAGRIQFDGYRQGAWLVSVTRIEVKSDTLAPFQLPAVARPPGQP